MSFCVSVRLVYLCVCLEMLRCGQGRRHFPRKKIIALPPPGKGELLLNPAELGVGVPSVLPGTAGVEHLP